MTVPDSRRFEPSSKTLCILLVDDHWIVRAGTRQILAESFDAEFLEASDAREALEISRGRAIDLAVVDVTMPGRSGIDLLADLHSQDKKTPVLMLSMHEEDQFARRAFKAGAAGYLTKTSVGPELVKAAQKLLDGGTYVSEKFAEHLAASIQKGGAGNPHDALSGREFEVFRLIASGHSGKEIAAALSLSFKTVSTYRTRILQKLSVGSNAELARYAVREGLI